MEKLELMNIIEEVILKKELRECELKAEASNAKIRAIKDDCAYFEEKVSGLLKRQSKARVFNNSNFQIIADELKSAGATLDELNKKLNKETELNDSIVESALIKKRMLDELLNKEEDK